MARRAIALLALSVAVAGCQAAPIPDPEPRASVAPPEVATLHGALGHAYVDSPALRAARAEARAAAEAARAEALMQAGRSALLTVEQDVLHAAGTAHATAVRDRARIEYGIGHVESLRRRLADMRARHGRGEASRSDVAFVEARYHRALADLRQAEADLAISRAQLDRITGSPR